MRNNQNIVDYESLLLIKAVIPLRNFSLPSSGAEINDRYTDNDTSGPVPRPQIPEITC